LPSSASEKRLIPSSHSLSAKTKSKRKRKQPVLRSKTYDDEEDEEPSLARVRESITFNRFEEKAK
jgi:hypothetical protein